MIITAKLAYKQLKTNRSLTLWALIAIALSTALTTSVCSFVASGNAMLADFLGTDYGAYGTRYMTLILIPAILIGSVILLFSVVVVSNVFRISATERRAQFGILKCVGATEKQIKTTVMYESIILSLIGIPVGIVFGLFLAYIGTGIANIFLEDLNSMTHIMINKFHLSISFVFSWQAILASTVICFATVVISSWIPAHKAAKTSALDSVRGVGTIKISTNNLHTNNLIQTFFGFEGILATKNMKRNRHTFRSTIIALSTGVILFMCLGALSHQANQIITYMNPDIDQTMVTEYTSAYTEKTNDKTGKEEIIYAQPIDSKMGDTISQRLSDYDGKSVFGIGNDMKSYYTNVPKDFTSNDLLDALEHQKIASDDFSVEIITLDNKNYKKLCEKADAPFGSIVLINHYSYNYNGEEKHIVPFLSGIKSIHLKKADGSKSKMTIQGILTQEEMPKELFYPNKGLVRLIVPQAQVRTYAWYTAPTDNDGFIAHANNVMKDFFPEKEGSNYMDEGFSTRVYRIDDYIKVMNIAIVLISVFMYSFVVLLLLIGFTNVVSTMSTNVMLRSREFAVLQSVGMTPEGLKQMLKLENLICSFKSLLLGLPIGILLTYFINLPIRSNFPIPYEFPWLSVLLCILSVILITLSTGKYAITKLQKQNIIETIRSESAR